jgi:hypothetical protein
VKLTAVLQELALHLDGSGRSFALVGGLATSGPRGLDLDRGPGSWHAPGVMLSPSEKLQVALDLAELAVEMRRAQVAREDSSLSPAEVGAKVRAWQHTRPGAQHGDAEGIPGQWPRVPSKQ